MTPSTSGAKFTVSALASSFSASIFERGQAMKKNEGSKQGQGQNDKGRGSQTRQKPEARRTTIPRRGRLRGARLARKLVANCSSLTLRPKACRGPRRNFCF